MTSENPEVPKQQGEAAVACTDWLALALEKLKEHGPMKIRPLAASIGHPNPRSLSMLLQWSQGRAVQECNRWRIPANETGQARRE